MAGFILGTGGGVLVAAAVYYTLSTDLKKQTASLRNDLRQNFTNLSSSFDPQAPPPAPVSYVGPSYPREPRFSETLRSRWNLAIANTVAGVREANWAATGTAIIDSGANLASRFSGPVKDEVEKIERKIEKIGTKVGNAGQQIVDRVEAAKDGIVLPSQGVASMDMGVVGGNVREESLTGGPVALVKAKRTMEGASGRLV